MSKQIVQAEILENAAGEGEIKLRFDPQLVDPAADAEQKAKWDAMTEEQRRANERGWLVVNSIVKGLENDVGAEDVETTEVFNGAM